MTNDAENHALEPQKNGIAVIGDYLKTLPNKPGVYRMLGDGGKVLYVGKAKDLKKRVTSYTKPLNMSVRIHRMVMQTKSMEFVTTLSEAEALLLEANLIKKLSPRYNILLRDDKSFPEILIPKDHAYPRVLKHRGAHKLKGDYFGPFASVWAVNETLSILQRAFLLRTCTDNVFANRTRPCLLFQIKRCSAPCVDRISEDAYGALVDEARDFLKGKSSAIQKRLSAEMEKASENLEFELAAEYRDRIRALTRIQGRQDINPGSVEDADVVALAHGGGQACVQVFFFRGGRNFGNRAMFLQHTKDQDPADMLDAFVAQFYAKHQAPKEIIVNQDLPGAALLAEALSVSAGRKVKIVHPRRGDKLALIQHAQTNAREALARRSAEVQTQEKMLAELADMLGLEDPPERVEVYDNSHVSGTNAIGAMIVAGPGGFLKKAYRKFNIKSDKIAPGDDYAMMREVLTRRFMRAQKAQDEGAPEWPDLVILDGGKGQLSIGVEVLEDLGVDGVRLCAVAKGEDRNAGRERIFQPDKPEIALEVHHPVQYFIQRLRDEAHRFAIGTHRAKRSKAFVKSKLDEIPGIGPKRKKALLHHFGSAKAVEEARLEDLYAVDGVSKSVASQIYDWFHGQ